MMIGDRLGELREQKKFSQRDIEKKTGLLCCYISRVEKGHTTPSVETLEKFACALHAPMYQLFHESDQPAIAPAVFDKKADDGLWGNSGKDEKYLKQLRRLMGKAKEEDRKLILFTLQKMAR